MNLVVRQRAARIVSALRIYRSSYLIRHTVVVNRSMLSSSASAAACFSVNPRSAALSTAQRNALAFRHGRNEARHAGHR